MFTPGSRACLPPRNPTRGALQFPHSCLPSRFHRILTMIPCDRRLCFLHPSQTPGMRIGQWFGPGQNPGLWVSSPRRAPLHPQAQHPGWLTHSLRGSVAHGLTFSRRHLYMVPPSSCAQPGVPGAVEPANLPREEGLPCSTWRTVWGERGANIRNHERSRTHSGTFKCCILNLYKDMKNLDCDSEAKFQMC